MKKLRKVFLVIQRKLICLLNYISPKMYMLSYCKYLQKIGVIFTGGYDQTI